MSVKVTSSSTPSVTDSLSAESSVNYKRLDHRDDADTTGTCGAGLITARGSVREPVFALSPPRRHVVNAQLSALWGRRQQPWRGTLRTSARAMTSLSSRSDKKGLLFYVRSGRYGQSRGLSRAGCGPVVEPPFIVGAGCSSEVERSLMVRWVVGSIPSWGGPIELFLVPASAPQLV